jgi:glycolate oxidase iron-sulfur subunit
VAHGDPQDTAHEVPRNAADFADRVRDISEVLAELGLPPATTRLASPRDPARPLRVGYHDPCHLAHAQQVRAAPRRLLREVPGVELVDLPNSDWCCGSAGVYNLTHPAMAEAQLTHKLESIEAVAPDMVVASNPGCMLHMARGARERGIAAPMVHLVEVLARAHPPEAR